jgi:hydrogenase nickel incorporation protein HypB
MQPRLLEIRQGILNKNDRLAADLRQQFQRAGVLVINVVSSPGSGKTALLERTLSLLRERGLRVAALVGDLETDNDARRLATSGVPVRQIVTAGTCHLEAEMIREHLQGWNLDELDILFIENVGNLVCPSSYDLGEEMRVVLMSVTEGEDKPLKYPTIFHSSDLAMLTKIDLAAAVEFDREAALRNIQAVRPGLPVLETSARKGTGLDAWVDLLVSRLQERRAASMQN